MSEKPKGIIVGVGSAMEYDIALPVTVWQSDNYAEDWYRDALAEARAGGDHNERRREIIFAVGFAESFIFEWTRRKLEIDEINDYLPSKPRFKNDPRYRREVAKKWKMVLQDLHEAGKIKIVPKLNRSRLRELFRYRHGLIHASASRPATEGQSAKNRPFPRKKDLKALKSGWAVSIVFDLISELCDQLGEPKPEYLQKP